MQFLFRNYRRLLLNRRYGPWVLLASLLYLISPLDLSPDLLPLLGQIDDVALIVLLLAVGSQWLSDRVLRGSPPSTPDSTAADPPGQTIDVEAVEVDSP